MSIKHDSEMYESGYFNGKKCGKRERDAELLAKIEEMISDADAFARNDFAFGYCKSLRELESFLTQSKEKTI